MLRVSDYPTYTHQSDFDVRCEWGPDGVAVFAPATVPETPEALADEETVIILVDDELAGRGLWLRVDAFAGGELVGSAATTATLLFHTVVSAEVTIGPRMRPRS